MGSTRGLPACWLAVLVGLLLVMVPRGSAATHPPQLLVEGDARYELLPYALYAEDPTGRWWPADLEGRLSIADGGPVFHRLVAPESGIRLGFSPHAQWFLMHLRHVEGHPVRRWLVVANPHLDRIDLLVGSQGQLLAQYRGGDLLPFDHRAVPHRQHVFPIDLLPGQDIELYLRIQSGSSLDAPVELWLPESLIRRDHASYLMLGLYFGITVGLIGHALVLLVAMRDSVYALYAGMRSAYGLGLLALSGLGAEFIWTVGDDWNRNLQQAGLTLSAVLAMQFARRFLDTGNRSVPMDRLLDGLGWIWMGCLLATSVWPHHHFVPQLLGLSVVSMGVLLVAGAQAVGDRHNGSDYFFLAWASALTGSLLELAIRLGYWPRPDLLSQPLVICSVIDMVLMAFALGERIRAERRAKQRAQAMQIREAARLHEVRRTSAEKSRLLAAVSHDLRQPVYAITLATQSLAQQTGRPVSSVTLMQMRAAIASADHMLDSLHTMSRLEVGALRPHFSQFSVQPLLERIDVIYGLQARAKGLRWTVTPCVTEVRSDAVLLERILGNLAANAVRYTLRGGVVVACRLRRDCLLIQVWDTGIGVPPENFESIFGAYFRGVPETETDNGVGLGLFIVRHAAALLGITLGLRSRPGRGSCFWLRIPLARVSRQATPEPAGPMDR